jgi:hypothetical protein
LSYSLVAIDARGRQSAGTTGQVPALGGRGLGLARLELAPGRYQVRLNAQAGSNDQQGLAIADVHVPAAGASEAVCGGFLIVQKDGVAVRPSVTRRLRADEGMMVAAVVSSTEPIPATFEALAQSGGAVLSLTMRNPAALGKGMWRYELTIPPPLPKGAIDLLLLAGDTPIPGCRSELWIE